LSGISLLILQSIDLNVIFTTGLLDVLAVIFLLFGLLLFVFYLRKGSASQTSANGGTAPKRPVGALSLAVLVLPLLGLLLVWSNIPSSTTLIIQTPTPVPTQTPQKPIPVSTPTPDFRTPGVLTVGIYTSYAPQEFTDSKGNSTGFDIALANALASKMKLRPTLVTDQFSNLLSDLQSQQVDIVIAGMTITSDQQSPTFIPYLKSVETLMIPKSNPDKIAKLSDLCGLRVGVVDNTPALADLQSADTNCKNAKESVITINHTQTDPAQIVPLLQSSKIDAAYLDVPVATYYMSMKQYKDQFTTAGTMPEQANQGIAIRQGDNAMINAVQKALQALQRDGTYTKLLKSNGWDFSSEAYLGQ
jgi:polar amino acid transport system substrate-binding protein